MKRQKFKNSLFIILFISMFIIIGGTVQNEMVTVVSETKKSGLPYILIKSVSNQVYNDLHAFKQNITNYYGNLPYSIVQENNKLTFIVNNNNNKIDKIEYTLLDTKTNTVLENGEINKENQIINKEQIDVKLKFHTNIKDKKQYTLQINTITKEQGSLYYYTHLKKHKKLEQELDFINQFHLNTFEINKEDFKKKYRKYLSNTQIKEEKNNKTKDISYVNLESSLDNILWTDFEVVKMSTPIINITNVNNNGQLTFQLSYVIASKVMGNMNYYNVYEQYNLSILGKEIKLDTFERKVNSILNVKILASKQNSISLGIMPDNNIQVKYSPNKKIIAFIKENQVWLLNQKTFEIIKVFSFDILNNDYILDRYNKHKVDILNVHDNGDITYMIYGYMNNGDYEGYNGILLNKYYNKHSANKKLAFIPYEGSFEELEYDINRLKYIDESAKKFYITLKNVYYSIDLEHLSAGALSKNLSIDKEKVYISNDNSIIAWQDQAVDKYNSIIYINDLNHHKEYQVRSKKKERVKILGYLNGDLVIGYADINNILEKLNTDIVFPMKKIEIRDRHNKVIKTYEPQNNQFVINYKLLDTKLTVKTALIKKMNIQKITQKEEIIFENKKDEKVKLDITKTVNSSDFIEKSIKTPNNYNTQKVTYINAKKIVTNQNVIDIKPLSRLNINMYYIVNKNNNLVMRTIHLAKAIKKATTTNATIYNQYAKLIWKDNSLSSKHIINNVPIIRQRPELPRGCEVVSVAMILNYYGEKANKMQLANEIIKTKEPYYIKNNIINYGDLHQGFVGNMYDTKYSGIGAYHEPVQALMKNYLKDKQVLDLTGIALEDLLYYVQQGKPVWINISNQYKSISNASIIQWMTPNGFMEISYTEHAVVIVGFDSNYIYYNDPSKGIMDKKPRKLFEQGWKAFGSQALTYY